METKSAELTVRPEQGVVIKKCESGSSANRAWYAARAFR
jgi:hypothetical protein